MLFYNTRKSDLELQRCILLLNIKVSRGLKRCDVNSDIGYLIRR